MGAVERMTLTVSSRDIAYSIVRIGLAPMLKRNGFRKTGLRFTRRSGTVTHCLDVDVQLPEQECGGSSRLRLNGCVMFDDFLRLRGRDSPTLPKSDDCDFNLDLGLLDDALSLLIVDDGTNVKNMAKWLSCRVEQSFVVPLNRVSCTRDFAATGWVDKNPRRFQAVFQYLIGNIEEARRLVQQEADAFADLGCTFGALARELRLSFE